MVFEDDIFDFIADKFELEKEKTREKTQDWKGLVEFLAKEQSYLEGQVSAYKESVRAIANTRDR